MLAVRARSWSLAAGPRVPRASVSPQVTGKFLTQLGPGVSKLMLYCEWTGTLDSGQWKVMQKQTLRAQLVQGRVWLVVSRRGPQDWRQRFSRL